MGLLNKGDEKRTMPQSVEAKAAAKAAEAGQPVLILRTFAAPALTARHLEVLRCYARVGSAPRVAEALDLRPSTVKAHLSEIRWRLQAASTCQAFLIALRRGLLTLDELEVPA